MKSNHLSVRCDDEMLDRIEKFRLRLEKKWKGIKVPTKGETVRKLIELGLEREKL